MATPDMDVIKEIPGYKVIMKAILKNQIQQLVEQLASTTDEECVILTASLTDGSLSYLGSDFGKGFIEDHQGIKSQFLSFCLKRHYMGKQQENRQQKAKTFEASIQDSHVDRNEKSPRSGSLQISPDRSKESIGVRFKPYPMTRSRRSAITSGHACEPSQIHVIKEIDDHTIKVEPTDENEGSNLSESDRPFASCNVATEANMKVSVNDYLAQQTTQSLVDSETDNTSDETLPRLSVKLETIAETLKTFAEHDSELEYNDVEPMGTVPETEPEIIGVELPRIMTHITKDTGLLDVKFETPSNDTDSQRGISETENTWSNLTNCDNSAQSFQSGIAVQGSQTKSAICNKCGKTFDESNASTFIIPGNRTIVKQFQCETCSRTSSIDNDFNRHNAKKKKKNQHKCDQCGKKFPSKSYLKKHLALHTGIKTFKCGICATTFTQKNTLTRHLALHSGIKPFKCDTCGKSFTQKSNLKSHLAFHSGDKPYECDTCGKSFTQKSNLKSHLAFHSGDKPYKCDTCGKLFKRKGNLTSHLASHSWIKPFKCDSCEKSFTWKKNLNAHLVVHLGVKPFNCDICGKSFARKHELARHIACHSGVKH